MAKNLAARIGLHVITVSFEDSIVGVAPGACGTETMAARIASIWSVRTKTVTISAAMMHARTHTKFFVCVLLDSVQHRACYRFGCGRKCAFAGAAESHARLVGGSSRESCARTLVTRCAPQSSQIFRQSVIVFLSSCNIFLL